MGKNTERNTRNVDENIYNQKSLYLLNIKELRDIGRKLSVPSPTTMKKQELVDYILNVVYGRVQVPSRSNYGRPSVRDFDMNKYLNKIKKNSDLTDELLNLKLDDFSEYDVSSLKVASPKPIDSEIQTRYFVIEDDKHYLRVHSFIPSEKDIEISKSVAFKYNLENYDVLEVKVEDKMYKIVSINGVVVEHKFDELNIENEIVEVENKKFFYIRTKEEIDELIRVIDEKTAILSLKTVIFATKKHEKIRADVVEYKTNNYSKMYKSLMQFVAKLEKLAYEGEDVVALIESFDDIYQMFESMDESVSERAKITINETINKFIAIGNELYSFKIQNTKNY